MAILLPMAPSFGSSYWLQVAGADSGHGDEADMPQLYPWHAARRPRQWTLFTDIGAAPPKPGASSPDPSTMRASAANPPKEGPPPKGGKPSDTIAKKPHAGDDKIKPEEDQSILPTQDSGTSIDDILAARAKNYREYKLLVDTGQNPRSFTDGDTFIQLIGNRDKSKLIFLKKGFTAGSRTEFSVFAKDIGRLEKIRIVANTTNAWFVDRIWQLAPEGNREFPVGRFLGWPNTPEVTVSPALVSMGPAGVALAMLLTGPAASVELRKWAGRKHCSGKRARALEAPLKDFL